MAGINVTYEQMRSAATDLNRGKEEILTKLNQLRTQMSGLVANGYVTAESSGAFDELYTEYNTGATKTAQALEQIAAFLNKAAEALEKTDSELAKAIRK